MVGWTTLHQCYRLNMRHTVGTTAHGTNRTWCDVRSESAFGGKAEVWLKGRQVRCGPKRDIRGEHLRRGNTSPRFGFGQGSSRSRKKRAAVSGRPLDNL